MMPTPDTVRSMADVIEAFNAGAEVQLRIGPNEWVGLIDPHWVVWSEYRIKPMTDTEPNDDDATKCLKALPLVIGVDNLMELIEYEVRHARASTARIHIEGCIDRLQRAREVLSE